MPGSPQNTINIVRNVIKQKVGNSDFFSNLEKMGRKASFFKKKEKGISERVQIGHKLIQ